MTLLDVQDLHVEYQQGNRRVQAVNGISMSIDTGESVGLVGESGCGKTTTAKALLRLLPDNAAVTNGSAMFGGHDLVSCSVKQMRKLRWQEIAVVPQTSMNSLDPVYRVGKQLREPLREHTNRRRAEVTERVNHVARLVDLDPRRLNDYPHQFSGGMRQRLVLAMSLVLDPKLLIADEPTTALDVITQHHILDQIVSLQKELGLGIVFITHDIGVVWKTCQKVAVMYAGKIVEWGDTTTVLTSPAHPYTMALRNSSPSIRSTTKLVSIPGYPPRLDEPPSGCPFVSRCPFATTECVERTPPLRQVKGRLVACHYAEKAEEMRANAADAATWQTPNSLTDVSP